MTSRSTTTRTVGALGAGLAAGLLLVPAVAGAQDDSDDDAMVVEAPVWFADVLDELVADGVISQAQADAVEDAFVEHAPARHGHRGAGAFGRHLAIDELAELFGIEPAELREQLVPGTTLAAVAEANGVSTDDLVAALLAHAEEHLAQAVENGRLTQDEADDKAADLEARITERVTTEIPDRPERGESFRGRGPRGRHHHDGAASDEEPALEDSSLSA